MPATIIDQYSYNGAWNSSFYISSAYSITGTVWICYIQNSKLKKNLFWKPRSKQMAEETELERARILKFQGLMIATLTLDQIIWYTVLPHSLTSTYTPSFIQTGNTFCGGQMHIFIYRWTNTETQELMYICTTPADHSTPNYLCVLMTVCSIMVLHNTLLNKCLGGMQHLLSSILSCTSSHSSTATQC